MMTERCSPAWWLMAIVFLVAVPAASADDQGQKKMTPQICPICRHAENRQADLGEKAASTLARGATNFLFGWTDAIRHPATVAKRGGPMFDGIVQGLDSGVKRTLVGAGELLTFWAPKVEGRYIDFVDDCPICATEKYQRPSAKPQPLDIPPRSR